MGLPVPIGVTPHLAIGDRRRVVIEHITPVVDCGQFPVRLAVGDLLEVEADVFADGHDELSCYLCYRHESQPAWQMERMAPRGNDRWRGHCQVRQTGRYYYRVAAGIDPFATWCRDVRTRAAAGQDLAPEAAVGAQLLHQAAGAAPPSVRALLLAQAAELERTLAPVLDGGGALATHVAQWTSRAHWTYQDPPLPLQVERTLARFGAWYEFFPRSCGTETPGFANCLERLAYIADLGFDVVYLPPIHPIGSTCRKGPDNALHAGPQDLGSPWAIGAASGGHESVHPELGTLAEFRTFRQQAEALGLEVALDMAFQCSPDHPYVQQHPEWFRHRPDGSIRYAENPPKQYQDIYPFDFESPDSGALWRDLRNIFLFWREQGVRIFRVDNPHTKSLPFWEWVLADLKQRDPDLIFLSEAFTRPRVMERLAKSGFTQSYTYFTWRNTRSELIAYFTELNAPPLKHYFWPNLWPNTPDILPEALQRGGRPAFAARAVLAATLSGNYGVYGPAFELTETLPLYRGTEEYRHSEKYERRRWDPRQPHSLAPLLKRLNSIRKRAAACMAQGALTFHDTDNEQLICYSRRAGHQRLLVIVNLDPRWPQSGWTHLDLSALGLAGHGLYDVYDALNDQRYAWEGARNFVRLDPEVTPAHIFRIPDEA